MKLTIDGTEYDLTESIQKATLGNLYVLKSKHGVSVKTIRDTFQRMQKSQDPLDFLDDEATFQSLIGIVWLARRHAGEKVSMEDCGEVSLSELVMSVDDEEQGSNTVPKALTDPDSVPDAGPDPDQD